MELTKLPYYTAYFLPDEVPDEIVKLLKFDEPQPGFYCQGFETDCSYFDGAMIKTYSKGPQFLKRLREFAVADGTGSTYAIWRADDDVAWGDSPIVAFGSEGGIHIVAKNLVELFRILTLDAEPMIVDEKVWYSKDKKTKASAGAADYVKWLAKTFKAKPVKGSDEAKEIVIAAQKLHETAFQKWMKRYQGN